MKHLIRSIAEHLAAADLGTLGVDLFYFHMPEQIQQGVLVIDNLDGTPNDPDIPGLKKGSFKVIVRTLDLDEGLEKADSIISNLDLHEQFLNPFTFMRIFPTHDPIPFPVPESDVIEIACNFWCAYYRSALK